MENNTYYVCGDGKGNYVDDSSVNADVDRTVYNKATIHNATRYKCDEKKRAEKFFFGNWSYLKDKGYKVLKVTLSVNEKESLKDILEEVLEALIIEVEKSGTPSKEAINVLKKYKNDYYFIEEYFEENE